MKRKTIVLAAALLISHLLCSSLWAAPTIFSDDFDSYADGLNWGGSANWTVSDGTVDLIGNGFFDALPGNGLYVDMDGSTNDAGKITSTLLDLQPGDYTLTFDLAGNNTNPAVNPPSANPNAVTVQLGGGLFDDGYNLEWDNPFTTYTETFTVTSPTLASLSFEGVGGDNASMLLDNVSVSYIPNPSPSAVLLGGIGVGLVGWLRRCRTL